MVSPMINMSSGRARGFLGVGAGRGNLLEHVDSMVGTHFLFAHSENVDRVNANAADLKGNTQAMLVRLPNEIAKFGLFSEDVGAHSRGFLMQSAVTLPMSIERFFDENLGAV